MDKPASSLALKLEAQSQPVTASVARSDFPTEETPSSSMEWLEENSLDTTSICPSSNIVFWGRYCLAIPTAFGLGFPMPDLLWSSCNGGYSALPGKSLWTNCCETILLWVNTGYPPELVSSCWLTVIPYLLVKCVNPYFCRLHNKLHVCSSIVPDLLVWWVKKKVQSICGPPFRTTLFIPACTWTRGRGGGVKAFSAPGKLAETDRNGVSLVVFLEETIQFWMKIDWGLPEISQPNQPRCGLFLLTWRVFLWREKAEICSGIQAGTCGFRLSGVSDSWTLRPIPFPQQQKELRLQNHAVFITWCPPRIARGSQR